LTKKPHITLSAPPHHVQRVVKVKSDYNRELKDVFKAKTDAQCENELLLLKALFSQPNWKGKPNLQ